MGVTRSTSGTYNIKILVDQSLEKRLNFIWENDIKRNIINKELGVSVVIGFDCLIVYKETNGGLS